MTYIYIELANFDKELEECKTMKNKWLFCLKNMSNLLERPVELQGRVFEKLFKTAEIAKFKPMDRKAYEQSINAYRDIKNGMDTAKRGGETIGLRKANIANAKKMKALGADSQFIQQVTGLTQEEIKLL